MNRSAILLLAALLGAGAVVSLLVLSGREPGGERRRIDANGDRAGVRAKGEEGERPGERGVQEVTPVQARLPGAQRVPAAVQPGAREPFDSEETIRAREQYAGRIEELVTEMINPDLRPDQRMAKKRELQDLLRLMGHRVSPSVRARLLEMLTTVEPKWRPLVADAIGSLQGDADTAKALVELLKSTPDDISTRHAIYSALGMMNVRDVTPSLMEMLGEGHKDEALIIRTIGQLATPEELELLFARLDQPLIAASRTEIERILQERGRIPGFFDKVAGALEGADTQKRRSLLRILSASIDPRHAAIMRDLLARESDNQSREIAIRALGKFGDAESGKVLLDLIEAGSPADQNYAVQAIQAIRNPETITALSGRWEGLKGEGRVALMGAMGRLQPPTDAMQKLAREEGLHDEELRVRTSAAMALGQRGRDDNIEALSAFLARSRHPAETNAALTALESIRTRAAAEAALRGLTAVPDERRRERWRQRFEKIAQESQ